MLSTPAPQLRPHPSFRAEGCACGCWGEHGRSLRPQRGTGRLHPTVPGEEGAGSLQHRCPLPGLPEAAPLQRQANGPQAFGSHPGGRKSTGAMKGAVAWVRKAGVRRRWEIGVRRRARPLRFTWGRGSGGRFRVGSRTGPKGWRSHPLSCKQGQDAGPGHGGAGDVGGPRAPVEAGGQTPAEGRAGRARKGSLSLPRGGRDPNERSRVS